MPLKSLTQGLEIGFKHALAEAPHIVEFADAKRPSLYLSAMLFLLPLTYLSAKPDNSSAQANNYSTQDTREVQEFLR